MPNGSSSCGQAGGSSKHIDLIRIGAELRVYGNWMAIFRAMALLGMLWSSHLDGDFVNAQQEEADEQCTRDDAPGHLGPLHALQDGGPGSMGEDEEWEQGEDENRDQWGGIGVDL